MPDCALAIDIGTLSTRAALVSADGMIADCAPSQVTLSAPRPGWPEQDPMRWWLTTVDNIRAVLCSNPSVKVRAVGTAARMHSTVPVDATGEPLVTSVGLSSDKRPAVGYATFRSVHDSLDPDWSRWHD